LPIKANTKYSRGLPASSALCLGAGGVIAMNVCTHGLGVFRPIMVMMSVIMLMVVLVTMVVIMLMGVAV
jgi:hypothetical protein